VKLQNRPQFPTFEVIHFEKVEYECTQQDTVAQSEGEEDEPLRLMKTGVDYYKSFMPVGINMEYMFG
jgi:hypothetical protein